LKQAAKEDDEKIHPVPHHPGQDDCHFDHPRNGTPEIGEELQELVGFLFRDRIRAVLGQPLLSFGLAEAVGRRPQLFLEIRHRDGLQVVPGLRLCIRFQVFFGLSF
jgi:hypothetical protein